MSLLLLAGVAAGKAALGGIQMIKARKLAKQNTIDGQKLNPEYDQMMRMAEQNAREGMATDAYTRRADMIGSNQAFGVRRLLGSGQRQNAGALANIVGTSNRATSSLNAEDAALQQQNKMRLLSTKQIIANAKQRSYEQNAQAIAALRGAGLQNITGAFDMVGGGAITQLDAGAEESPLFNLRKKTRASKYFSGMDASYLPNGYEA